MALCFNLPPRPASAKSKAANWIAVTTLMLPSCLLFAGCGIGTVTNATGPIQGDGHTMQGKVHGGQQPVVGATIQLYAAGASAYGSGSSPLLTAPVTTNSNGAFSITNDYVCPSGDAQVYLTATGGNPGLAAGTNNAALVLMAALGSCNSLQANAASTFISIDEVTTIASAFALAQFASASTTSTGIAVGTSAGNGIGLSHAMATVNNLVDLSNGSARSITPAYASNPVFALNTSAVPQARINTLADILSSCVNTTGTSGNGSLCTQLFTLATPPNGTAPVDTLQAALNIAQNPGNNASALFALSQSNGPFRPTLTTPPTDWLLAIGYTGAGLGLPPGDTVAQMQNNAMAIDAAGTVWVTANGAMGIGIPSGSEMITQFDYLGTPLTPATTQPSPSVVNFGGYHTPYYGSIAFDETGDAWITDTGTGIQAFSPGPTPVLSTPIQAPDGILAPIVIDASNNIWASANQGSGELLEYGPSGTFENTGGMPYTGGGGYPNNYYGTLFDLTFDNSGNLWSSDSLLGDLYLIDGVTGQLINDYYPMAGTPTNLVAGAAGNVYSCPAGPTSMLVFSAANTTGPIATYPLNTGRGCGGPMAADGLGNVWVLTATGFDEYSSTGVLISPANTYTATSAGEAATFQNLSTASAIDASGNLWVLNTSTGADPTNPRNVLFQLVGAAAPVVTPLSQALANGQVATRP